MLSAILNVFIVNYLVTEVVSEYYMFQTLKYVYYNLVFVSL